MKKGIIVLLLIAITALLLTSCGESSSRGKFKVWLNNYKTMGKEIITVKKAVDGGDSNAMVHYTQLMDKAGKLMQEVEAIDKGLNDKERKKCQEEMQVVINDLTTLQSELNPVAATNTSPQSK